MGQPVLTTAPPTATTILKEEAPVSPASKATTSRLAPAASAPGATCVSTLTPVSLNACPASLLSTTTAFPVSKAT